MQRIIRLLVCLFVTFGAAMALAQAPNPLPVQGNLSSIIGNGQQYAGVSIQLQNCASPVSIAGYSVIVQQGYQVMANGSGLVNTTVWPNDLITCNGTTGNSQYQLSYTANGAVQGTPQCYQVVSTQGTWNLQTQQPIICSQSAPNPADQQYRNLNLTGFISGVSGSMSGTWQAATFISTGLAGSVGKCVQIGTGGQFTAASVSCGGTAGVSQIIAGTNVTISPTGGTGAVTINSTGGGGGGSGTVNAGTTGQFAYYPANGNAVSGKSAAAALIALGASPLGGYPGIQFIVDPSNARIANYADIETTLGYVPLDPAHNLGDVSNKLTALKNLFSGASLLSSEMIGTDNIGNPTAVTIGPGLLYAPSSGVGSVTALSIDEIGSYSGSCPGVTISGGGGSGATGVIICSSVSGHGPFRMMNALVTNGGSGYTSVPTVTLSDLTGGGAVSASIGSSALLTTSWQSGTIYSVAGTPLPSCSSTYLLERYAVSDATAATPGTTYAGGGPYSIPVQCIFNATGSVYTWIID